MPRKRVLLIDDEWDNLECVQEILQSEFEVVAACGGEAGIECLFEQKFDAVVLDLTMPTVDGFEVMHLIKRRLPNTPVLLASGLPDLEGIAAQVGAQDWMSKPCRFPELVVKVRRLTSSAEARDLDRAL